MSRLAAFTLTAIAATGFTASAPSFAQQATATQSMCGDRTEIVDALSKEFKESPMALGMVDQTAVMEVFVSDVGTWTIIASRTDGSSCIIASGEGWQSHVLIAGKDA